MPFFIKCIPKISLQEIFRNISDQIFMISSQNKIFSKGCFKDFRARSDTALTNPNENNNLFSRFHLRVLLKYKYISIMLSL